MMRLTMSYPGDPPCPVILMFGAEFVKLVPNRKVVLTNIDTGEEESFPVTEVVCDSCNDAIGMTDPCCLQDDSRLYCWACFQEWIRPYLPREER